MPADTQEGVPPTPFARALLIVCDQVFASATIPRAWLCASIVSIDKKDGDPLNPGDKRGIALINVGLKLVYKVLQMRIERFVETNNLLSYEQAGFCKREECVGQVVSLVDIIQRRQNAGINTHVLFIDIRKAFDTVPVGALLWSCRTWDSLVVLLPFSRHCTHPHLLELGQSLDYRKTQPHPRTHVRRRCAVFADSEQSLLAASTAIEQWANRWEMQFGVTKCGIIRFTGHLAPRLDNPLDIRLHGQLVSRVESYKYLGLLIDSKLDHLAWLNGHGKAYYGLELVGGNKSHLAPLQNATRVSDCSLVSRLSTAIGPLWLKLGLGHFSLAHWYHGAVGKIPALVLVSSDQTAIQEQILADTTSQTKDSQATTLVCIDGDSANMWRLCITPKVCHSTIMDTSGFFKDPSFDQSRAHGTRYLMLARMDALWTARKAIQIGILVDTHPFSVDHCILCDQQLLSTSIAHLVVECEQVTGHRIQSGLVPAIQKSRLRLLGRALDLGVEECIYLAPRWSLKWQSRSEPVVGWTGLWSMNLWGRDHANGTGSTVS
ncbi:hypothetical protein BASA81_004976 [Batrachochytrium salamandrivorans]|nr:hypothetical protein BASA81_004976 [Batrachochytrium salamandrivorans]